MQNDKTIETKKMKSRLDLLPPNATFLVGQVFAFGAQKHEPWGWSRGQFTSEDYRAALLRHSFQAGGEQADKESGLPHLAHAAASALIALELAIMDAKLFAQKTQDTSKVVPLKPAEPA